MKSDSPVHGVMCALAVSVLVGLVPANPLRVFVVGDNHGATTGHRMVVAGMLAEKPLPSLLLNAGDLTNGGTDAEYAAFFAIESTLLAGVEFLPAVGNHDAENIANWFEWIRPERWLTVRLGDTLAVHLLDCTLPRTPGSEQYEWLLGELRADSAARTKHIFAVTHYPVYTTCGGPGDTTARAHLSPLFERFGVRLVFSGHTHAYEHSLVNGVHYIMTGCGGGGLADSTKWRPRQSWTVWREARFGFLQVEISDDTVRSVGIRIDGSRYDSTLVVGDSTVGGLRQPSSAPWLGGTDAARVYDATGRRVGSQRLPPGVYFRPRGPGLKRRVVHQ